MTVITGPAPGGPPDEVFDDLTCARLEAAFGQLPHAAQPEVYAAARHPERAQLRQWLNEQTLTLPNRPEMLARLRDDRGFSAALAELAAADALVSVGFDGEIGPRWGSGATVRTPDLLLRDQHDGRPALLAEVWTRAVPDEEMRTRRRWAELADAIGRIGVPVVLAVERPPGPPDEQTRPLALPGASTRRRIIREVSALTDAPPPGTLLHAEGLAFRVLGPTTTGRAHLIPVGGYTVLTRRHIIDALETKVRRYRTLCAQLDLPLLVVLSGEPNTGLSPELVEGVLVARTR